MDSQKLYAALVSLATLRNRWGFYAADLDDEARQVHAAHKEALTYALTLWLLDAYYTGHDILKRNQITARLARRKFPENMNRKEIAAAIVTRLKAVRNYIETTPTMLRLMAEEMAESYMSAKYYFENPAILFSGLSLEEGELILTKLTTLIADEELF